MQPARQDPVDAVGRSATVTALANIGGIGLLIASALLVDWFKSSPWKSKDGKGRDGKDRGAGPAKVALAAQPADDVEPNAPRLAAFRPTA